MNGNRVEMDLPPGFRFHPTDDELVVHYLCKKCSGQAVAAPIIAETDLYKYDPWELPKLARYGEKEWYFFSPRDRKYPNGSRPNRAAGSGYWKATGADKPVGKPTTLGIKKALVFYAGKAPRGTKTNWIMHEYRLANVDRSASNKNNNLRLDEWVLCRIYNKKGTMENPLSAEGRRTEMSSFSTEDVKFKQENYVGSQIVRGSTEYSESGCSEEEVVNSQWDNFQFDFNMGMDYCNEFGPDGYTFPTQSSFSYF